MEFAEVEGGTQGQRRSSLLELLESWLEKPMLFLAIAWLLLLVVEFAWGLTPLLETVGKLIWIVFVLEFVLRFSLAPRKLRFLRKNWLTALSLLVPALRLFSATSPRRWPATSSAATWSDTTATFLSAAPSRSFGSRSPSSGLSWGRPGRRSPPHHRLPR